MTASGPSTDGPWKTPDAAVADVDPVTLHENWPDPAEPTSPRTRLLVTLPTLAVAEAGFWIPIPGLNVDQAVFPETYLGTLGAMGVQVHLSALLVVELVAWLVPPLSRLRHAGPAGRLQLERAAVPLIGIFAGLYGAFLASRAGGYFDDATMPMGSIIVPVAYAYVLAIGAHRIRQRGVGNGYSVLIIYSIVRLTIIPYLEMLLAYAPLFTLVPVVAAGALTVRVVHRVTSVPAPMCGLVPLSSGTFMVAGMQFILIVWPAAVLFELPETWPWQTELAIVVSAALIFSWWFNPTHRLSRWLDREALQDRRRSMEVSVLYIVALFGIQRLLTFGFMEFWLHIIEVVVFVAIARDIRREWAAVVQRPDLVPVWPLNHPAAARPVYETLDAAGIPVFLRGTTHRVMLQAFGPYIPIDVMVPAAQTERARTLIHARLTGLPNPALNSPVPQSE